MKVIDLLNKIANGEKVPKIIKYGFIIYEYSKDDNFYYNDGWSLYRDFYGDGSCLNDEVEVIEETKKIENLSCCRADDEYFVNKINEIIDYINKE